MTIITIGSSDPNLDVFAVADVMETKGTVHIIVRRNFYPFANPFIRFLCPFLSFYNSINTNVVEYVVIGGVCFNSYLIWYFAFSSGYI